MMEMPKSAAGETLKPKNGLRICTPFTQALAILLTAVVASSPTPVVAESALDAVGAALSRLHTPAFSQAGPASNSKEFEYPNQLLDTLSEVERNRPEILNNMAGLAHRQGRHSDALKILEQAVKLSPSYASIEQNLTLLRRLAASGDSAEVSARGINFLLIDAFPAPGVLLAKCDAEYASAQRVPRCTTVARDATAMPLRPDSPNLSDTSQDAATAKTLPNAALAGEPDLNDISQVRREFAAWINSWEQREIGAYLSFYGPNFSPTMGRAKWELMRHVRLARARNIKVGISDLQVQVRTRPSTVMTSFVQHYRDDTFSDQVHKVLVWRRYQGKWRIASEETRP